MESVGLSSHYRKATERYVLDGTKRLELIGEMEIPGQIPGKKTTSKQCNTYLKSKGIFKNFRYDEAIRILWESRRVNISAGTWMFLVLANGILLNLDDLETYCRRKSQREVRKGAISVDEAANQADHNVVPTTERHLLFVYLPFEFQQLKSPSYFQCFQRILWLVGVHFHSSFDTGKWKTDQDGLCNRSDTDRAQVKELSQFHNTIFEALARYRREQEKLVGPFTCVAFRQLERIVNISHHRQIPDILGTIRLIQRNISGVQPQGQKTLVTLLCEQLHALAAQVLQPTDPRIQLFEMLKELPQDQKWDSQGHTLMAFDAYCRHLWFARLGRNDIKAYYSYNQASFPRAEPGQFYETFEGKSMHQILTILRKVDLDLGPYSVATFCLWHTAIHYLFHERRYSDSETLCCELSKRILGPFKLHSERLQNFPVDFDTAESHCHDLAERVLAWLEEEADDDPQVLHHGQLGFDIVKTFHLLGRSQEEQARSLKLLSQFREERNMLEHALLNFDIALHLRLLTARNGIWDPLLKSVLMALISVGTDLRLDHGVEVWRERLQAVIMTVSENDRAQRDLENKIPASTGA